MRTQDTDNDRQSTRRLGVGVSRATFVIVLSVLLGVSGTIALAGTFTLDIPKRSRHIMLVTTPAHQPPPSLTSSPGPTLPPPAPISPLPTDFQQEVSTLKADHRLLYNGDTTQLEVALTFDDGPNPYYTPEVLDVLQRYKVKATFFCVGSLVTAYPGLVQQEYAAGHTVGNHSWSHPQLPLLSGTQIQRQLGNTSNAIKKILGVPPTFFRPPYGAYDGKVLTLMNSMGLTTVMWNVDPRDWSRPGTNVIINRVVYQTGRGSIILMHDGGGNRSQTVMALPSIIENLRSQGFTFVTLPQLVADMEAKHIKPTPTPEPAKHISLSSPLFAFVAWRRDTHIM